MTKKSELRKAAVLIASLDEAAADALLAKFPPAQATAILEAAEELGEITPEERRRVTSEFLSASDEEESEESGVELDDSLARKLVDGYVDPPPWSPSFGNHGSFRFLHEAPVSQLVRLLAGERPQTIALVLAHLPADKAANTLGRLDPAQQAEVLTRLAELDDTSPQVLKEIEEELHGLLAETHRISQKRAAGFASVSAILGAANRSNRQRLLENLAARDSKLLARLGYPARSAALGGRERADRRQPAERLQAETAAAGRNLPQPAAGSTPAAQSTAAGVPTDLYQHQPGLSFDDLLEMDDVSLAAVVARADRQILRLALSGAEDALIARITVGLKRGQAKRLRRQLLSIGPVRLSDVEAAQEQLAALATRLCQAGIITSPLASITLIAG